MENNWISVKDRLPEFQYTNHLIDTTEKVLLYGIHGVNDGWFKKIKDTGDIIAEGLGAVDKYSTHWMPLPQPPKN